MSVPGDNRLPVLLAQIEHHVESYRDALIRTERANRTAQHAALSSVCELHLWFVENEPSRVEFYKSHDIRIDPRSRYAALPLVKHFMAQGEPCPELQTRASYWSGAIEAGILLQVNAEDFVAFIDQTPGGVHGAYKIAADWNKAKHERIARALSSLEAVNVFQAEFRPEAIPSSKHTDTLSVGKHLAIVERNADGKAYLATTIPDSSDQADKWLQRRANDFAGNGSSVGKPAIRPKARRRYQDAVKRVNPIILKDDHSAIIEGTTRHSHLIRKPNPQEMVLKSGENSRKLGSVVEKGKWKGFPIFSLSLEERKTCPRSCSVWDRCYGNGMGKQRHFDTNMVQHSFTRYRMN